MPKRKPQYLLSDGLAEQYVSHSYPRQGSDPVFEVNDIKFTAHAEQNV